MPKVAFAELVDFGTRLLTALGAPAENARYVAEAAAATEAAGVHTHGLVLLWANAEGVAKGGVDPTARPEIVAQRAATATIEGNRCFSGLAMKLAVETAEAKARDCGVAMVGVRNTSWVASLGPWLLPLAEAGLFAQLWAQSSQCKDSAPVGGIEATFSTNPVGLAFPAPGGPVVADFSSAAFSMGKVNTMAAAGEKAIEPVFLDKDGNLSDDPNTVLEGGAMLCAGGRLSEHKGYALALWCEALTAMAGGHCNNPQLEQRQCFNLTVIDPAAFADQPGYYEQEMTRFLARVKASRLRPGYSEIRLPGERTRRAVAASKTEGVEVPEAVMDKLQDAARSAGVQPPKQMG